jgi:uncharacterized protein YjdB
MRYGIYGSIAIQGVPGAVYQVRQGSKVVRDDVTVPAGGSITVSDLLIGTYSVTEKTPAPGYLANGTPQEAALTTDGQTVSLTFTSYRLVTITIQKSDVTVYGGNDGQIVVTASGGAGTYEYCIGGDWQSGNVFTGLTGGIYNARARDKVNPANVSAAAAVEITQPGVDGTSVLSKFPAKVRKDTFYQIALPAGYTDPNFTSSNNAIAAVYRNGIVHFITSGRVKLTMKATFNGKIKTVSRTVTVLTDVKSITLSYTDLTITKGKLTATVFPADAGNKKVTWSSSDPKVAIVSQAGVVTAKSPGTVTITAVAKDGSGVKAAYVLIVAYSIQAPK